MTLFIVSKIWPEGNNFPFIITITLLNHFQFDFNCFFFLTDETIDFDETYGVNVQFEESDDDVRFISLYYVLFYT